jgi:translation initiation factor 1
MGTNLGDLLAKAGMKASEPAPVEEQSSDPPVEVIAFAPKVVVRRTKKGRGGKTVTLVQGVETGLDSLVAVLKKQLGAGARVEEGELVIQGDHVERVSRWLESQPGISKVVRG